jgi:hypothetical protein
MGFLIGYEFGIRVVHFELLKERVFVSLKDKIHFS